MERVSGVLRLDLATMRWEPMAGLVTARYSHACCVVRGALVVLGGSTQAGGRSSSVEMLYSSEEGGTFADLPPLSCGGMWGTAGIAVEESDSATGQVLLLEGGRHRSGPMATVQLVDLATGECAPQNNLLHPRSYSAAGRLPDGRFVCAGGWDAASVDLSSAEVWGPPAQGPPDAVWSWRMLPEMSADRYGGCGCVMSDGRFAVLGGMGLDDEGSGSDETAEADDDAVPLSSCEALVVDGDAHWAPLPPMHDARSVFACGAVAGCVIVAGGYGFKSAELYDVELNRWLRLPCDLPYESGLECMGSAVL
jgi:hypothetical protein